IAGADALEWDSLLVFTGVTHRADLPRPGPLPTFVGADIRALCDPPVCIRAGKPSDAPAVAGLLTASGLAATTSVPDDELTLIAEEDGTVTGTVAFSFHEAEPAFVRSLAVSDHRRRTGLGTLLIANAIHACRARDIGEVYLVTETAQGFFRNLGFVPVGTLETLPALFREFADACAASASVLRFVL
ncbi:MAG: GNAT family N-acetyltransferase, partial [Actinomycetota bacterium]